MTHLPPILSLTPTNIYTVSYVSLILACMRFGGLFLSIRSHTDHPLIENDCARRVLLKIRSRSHVDFFFFLHAVCIAHVYFKHNRIGAWAELYVLLTQHVKTKRTHTNTHPHKRKRKSSHYDEAGASSLAVDRLIGWERARSWIVLGFT